MTEGKNGSSDNPENVKNDLTGCCVKSRLPKDMKIKCGQLFGPFVDPLQWLAIKCTEPSMVNHINSIDRKSIDLFNKIDVARDSKEQNMDIILVNGQFYFRSTVSVDASTSTSSISPSSSSNNPGKLLAWFDDDLNSRLPMASMATLNGSKRYYCSLCNQISLYPNPVVIHILFECPKRHEILVPYMKISTNNNSKSSDNREIKREGSSTSGSTSHSTCPTKASPSAPPSSTATRTPPTVTAKKRSFDIDSLVNGDKFNDEAGKKSRFYSEVIQEFNSNNYHLPESLSLLNSLSPLSLTSPSNRLTAPPSPNSQPSAFRKVDKSNRHFSGINTSFNQNSSCHQTNKNQLIPNAPSSQLDFASSSIYSRGLNCDLTSTLLFGHPSFIPPGLTNSLLLPTQPPTPSSSSVGSSTSSESIQTSGHHLFAAASAATEASISRPVPSSVRGENISSATVGSGAGLAVVRRSSPSSSVHGNNSNTKSMIPPSLLPFLPPSLAALSFPQTNWCAKCNATFRMTSDLVYHMRSHHKKETPVDQLKKKREEKLRCNICDESFRERHHLTRHMTSHQ